MRKSIFAFIAIILAGILIVSAPPKMEQAETVVAETCDSIEDFEEFLIEPLSDKNIYFVADTALPNISVVNDMVDLANGYAIMRAVYCDAELWFRFGMVVNDEIGQTKTDIIKDKAIRKETERYVNSLVEVLPSDTALWEEVDTILWTKVLDACEAYGNKLASRFALNRYGKITEKDVARYMNKEQFISDYDSVYDLRRKQSEENERYLESMARQSPDFDKQCLYVIEFAHQRRYDGVHPAIPMLEELMQSGHFSRYLHEVWRIWRCLKQVELSPSRDGMIQNLAYNEMRYRCLNTILRQIIKNPKDIWAINDFCYLATYDNIIRYSSYLFGNSAPLEQMMLFPEITEGEEQND